MKYNNLFNCATVRICLYSNLILMFFTITGCGKRAKDIPLTEIEKHRMFQDETGAESLQEQYKLILSENPNSPIAYYLLGRCTNDLKEKIHLNEKALEVKKEFYYSNLSLGDAYLIIYDSTKLSTYLSTAEEYYINAEKSPDKNYLVDYQLSLLYETKGNVENNFNPTTMEQKLQCLEKAQKHMLKAKKAKDHEQIEQNQFSSKIDFYTSEISKIKNKLSRCQFKERDLRTSEIERMNRISGMILYYVNVYYLGDCKYQVNFSAFDQMYGNWKTGSIKYEWTSDGWNRLSN